MQPRTALSIVGAITATVTVLAGIEMSTPYQIPASAYSVDMEAARLQLEASTATAPPTSTTYNTVPTTSEAPTTTSEAPTITQPVTNYIPNPTFMSCYPEPHYMSSEQRYELMERDYGYWLILAIGQGWPNDDQFLDQLAKIIHGESRGYPNAKSGAGDYGLMQINWPIHAEWLYDYGISDPEQLYDPQTNLRVALYLYLRAEDYYDDGWQPWNRTR